MTSARERLTEASYRHPTLEAGARLWSSPRPARRDPCLAAGRRSAGFVVAAKGAPEAIAGLCRLGAADRAALTQSSRRDGRGRTARAWASPAPRMPGRHWPDIAARIRRSSSWACRPCRSAARQRPDAVARMPSAGIKAVMITGDYPATAEAIARQAGLERGERHHRRGTRAV